MTNKFISEERIEELSKRPYFKIYPEQLDLIKQGLCTNCKKEITDFKNDISIKEYNISGLCQECQDKVFKNE